MPQSYVFYSDPGHGWLEVQRSELIALGILFQVSHCSYQRGETVYLEEDCDASLFVQAKRDAGDAVTLIERHNDSPIRNYAPFSAT